MAKFETLEIKSGNTSALIIPERGGLVSRFMVDGEDVLYCDQSTVDNPELSLRAGNPLLFPQAGPLPEGGKYPLKQHGFVRNLPWKIIESGEDRVILELTDTPETLANFPFPFKLVETVVVSPNKLDQSVKITNIGEEPMPTAFGIHPYFLIPNDYLPELTTNIPSFKGPSGRPSDTSSWLDWNKSETLVYTNPGQVEIYLKDRTIKLDSDPELFRWLMIWWEVGKDFVCFEPWSRTPGALNNPYGCVWIEPGQSLDYRWDISVAKKLSR